MEQDEVYAVSDRMRLKDLLELPEILQSKNRHEFYLHIASMLRMATEFYLLSTAPQAAVKKLWSVEGPCISSVSLQSEPVARSVRRVASSADERLPRDGRRGNG